MRQSTLERILSQIKTLKVMVIGDYFLDHYLEIDPHLEEKSVETGKPARQVTNVRSSPGAAGSVVTKLQALGTGQILAVGIIGTDCYGFELKRQLNKMHVQTFHLISTPQRLTPTYIKPLQAGEELNRLDVQNRIPTPAELERELITILQAEGPSCDAIIVTDQVEEAECGVITTKVREALNELGRANPNLIILVDSRARIDKFKHVIIKPNEFEAKKAVTASPQATAKALFNKTQRPVFLTCGKQGQWVYTGSEGVHVPAIPVKGPIDIVGAGDSTAAGIVLALASGASPQEAAFFGNLIASITITKLGTTGTASPIEVLSRFAAWRQLT